MRGPDHGAFSSLRDQFRIRHIPRLTHSRHNHSEQIRLLASVEPVLKLRQVPMQVLVRDAMEGAHDTALQERECGLNRIRVDDSIHVLAA